jgi:hypothetical protein
MDLNSATKQNRFSQNPFGQLISFLRLDEKNRFWKRIASI